ncbi:MAG: DUF2779 domain-containing protein [Bacteroidetes bacterium]|nr:DUF2779 domain-containing protein [Bacteroidota bacterium]
MLNLSKSRFLSGCQCEKKLFFDIYRKDLKPPTTEAKQAVFDTGHVVGALAQKLYPGGKDVNEGVNKDWQIAINRTKEWLDQGIQTIYEATFSSAGGFAAVDILHHQNGERWAIEVKSSGSIKPHYITDASFQYFVMKQSGYTPGKVFLMYVDKSFIKNGEIVPEGLFTLEEITQQVVENQAAIEAKHTLLLAMLSSKDEPIREIGKHCEEPFECDYMRHCCSHLPDNNVLEIYSHRGKGWELYQQGIHSITDIPEDAFTNARQQVQITGTKSNALQIDHQSIKEFMSSFSAPLYFFDFETINPTLPVLDGTSPFQQVPFQYSLHITDLKGEILDHREFLAEPEDFYSTGAIDPRRKLIDQLKKDIPADGTIVVYYAGFEVPRLKELAEAFPEEREFIESLIGRVKDLLIPFKAGWYFDPKMKGGNSIKIVLPAIDPNYSYKDLEITNGSDASNIFLSMTLSQFSGDKEKTKKAFLEYCKRDSEGMVVIYRHLISLYN